MEGSWQYGKLNEGVEKRRDDLITDVCLGSCPDGRLGGWREAGNGPLGIRCCSVAASVHICRRRLPPAALDLPGIFTSRHYPGPVALPVVKGTSVPPFCFFRFCFLSSKESGNANKSGFELRCAIWLLQVPLVPRKKMDSAEAAGEFRILVSIYYSLVYLFLWQKGSSPYPVNADSLGWVRIGWMLPPTS